MLQGLFVVNVDRSHSFTIDFCGKCHDSRLERDYKIVVQFVAINKHVKTRSWRLAMAGVWAPDVLSHFMRV